MDKLKFPKILSRASSKVITFNIIFVLVFLNIWDFIVSRELINAMVLGIIMFAPVTIMWKLNSFKASMLATLYSIFLSFVLAVFFAEGYQGGTGWLLKLGFWLPYLVVAVVNALWGLRIYSKYKEKIEASLNES